MHRATTISLVCVLAALALPSSAGAQGRRGRNQPTAAQATVTVTFTSTERQTLLRYYAAHPYTAKRLSPGIAKNLARGKPLPPGIAKRALPADLVAQLPRRTGLEITIFGDRIVLLEARGVVVDVLENVFR